jgi:hypothetical protein
MQVAFLELACLHPNNKLVKKSLSHWHWVIAIAPQKQPVEQKIIRNPLP